MSHNFITNNTGQKVLRDRVNTLISISDELKFLVGFFYFSGWKEVYEQLKANSNFRRAGFPTPARYYYKDF